MHIIVYYIKLDMKLIRNVDKDNLKSALVRGMVEFSKASNVKLIAEGIETYDELETIVNLGVQYGRGYYIQEPSAQMHRIDREVIETIKGLIINKDRMTRNDVFNSSIKGLCDATVVAPPDEPVLNAYDIIKRNPESCTSLNRTFCRCIAKPICKTTILSPNASKRVGRFRPRRSAHKGACQAASDRHYAAFRAVLLPARGTPASHVEAGFLSFKKNFRSIMCIARRHFIEN